MLGKQKNTEKNKVLIDNWTLQEIAYLLKDGINNDLTQKYSITNSKKSKMITVPHSAVQIESLFKLLTEIVSCDQLIVDQNFTNTWKLGIKPLDHLEEKRIILPDNFEKPPEFIENSNLIIENLNLPRDLMKKHRENVAHWNKYKENKDNFLSPLIWGTSGNLCRGHSKNIPYSPHPTRATLLESSPFSTNKLLTATDQIFNIIKDKRIEVISRVYKNSKFNIGIINLNPIIIEIIESAKSVNNMFTIALQMREKHKKFRTFVSNYQLALNEGETNDLLNLNNLIEDVGSEILGKNKISKYGEIEINLGVGKIKLKTDITNKILSKFGVKSVMHKFILKKNSEGTIEKLFQLFNENNLRLRQDIKTYFIANK